MSSASMGTTSSTQQQDQSKKEKKPEQDQTDDVKQQQPPANPLPDRKERLRMQIMSDIHLEFRPKQEFDFPIAAPVLALLGDIGLVRQKQYQDFLVGLAAKPELDMILVVAGNHEFYGSSLEETKETIREICKSSEKLVFMDCASVKLFGIRILGCTLWSETAKEHIQTSNQTINDHRCITIGRDSDADQRKFLCQDKNKLHRKELSWLQEEIKRAKENNEPVCVLTHHAPTLRNVAPPIWEDSNTIGLNGTNLEYMFGSDIHTWCYGHTHWTIDQTISGTRVVSNQRGYPNHHDEVGDLPTFTPFNDSFVVEI